MPEQLSQILLSWLIPQLEPVFNGIIEPRSDYLEFVPKKDDFEYRFGHVVSKIIPKNDLDNWDFSEYKFYLNFWLGESDFFIIWYQEQYVDSATEFDFKRRESRATNKYPLTIKGFNSAVLEMNQILDCVLEQTKFVLMKDEYEPWIAFKKIKAKLN